METVSAALIGLALSATCGFRVFVPLLAVCLSTRAESADGEPLVELAENFNWLASDPVLVVFLVAAIFEIAGYYLPIIDNFLDALATPAAVIAGSLITAAFLTSMEPWLQWLLGIIAGGGIAPISAADASANASGGSVPIIPESIAAGSISCPLGPFIGIKQSPPIVEFNKNILIYVLEYKMTQFIILSQACFRNYTFMQNLVQI